MAEIERGKYTDAEALAAVQAAGLAGYVLLQYGIYANIPAAGTAGRIYFATDNGVLYYDTGATWAHVARTEITNRLAQLAEKNHASLDSIPASSDTVSGHVELATGAETNTGTDAARAVTPDGLDDWTGSAQITTVGTLSAGDVTAQVSAASTTVAGKSELAIASEINTGTDATRANTPDSLAGSNFGIRYLQAVCFDFTTDVATGNGKMYWHIPPALNGMNLVYCHAEVITAGTTGTLDIQIHELVGAVDMLSTVLTVDSAETGSDTAATPYVINAANDDVATNDVIRVDVDVIHTTPCKGLIITLGFQLP